MEHRVNEAVTTSRTFKDDQELARFRFADRTKINLTAKGHLSGGVMLGYVAESGLGFRFPASGFRGMLWRVEAIFEDLRRFF
jgi:hypothetical protein